MKMRGEATFETVLVDHLLSEGYATVDENAVPIIIDKLQKFPFTSCKLAKMAAERGEDRSGVLHP